MAPQLKRLPPLLNEPEVASGSENERETSSKRSDDDDGIAQTSPTSVRESILASMQEDLQKDVAELIQSRFAEMMGLVLENNDIDPRVPAAPTELNPKGDEGMEGKKIAEEAKPPPQLKLKAKLVSGGGNSSSAKVVPGQCSCPLHR